MKEINIHHIKHLGKNKSPESLNELLKLWKENNLDMEIKREIASSIGRQNEKDSVLKFIQDNYQSNNINMDIVYQMARACLINKHLPEFKKMLDIIQNFYNNEYIQKMQEFYEYKKQPTALNKITPPMLLEGDCTLTIPNLPAQSVQLIFTSPPYYNARDYVSYKSYQDYLDQMQKVLEQCQTVLEDGRFIVINVSPVISKRAGRNFESTRYPIPYDFHRLLTNTGFEYIDDIVWIKPEYSVTNRNATYAKNQMPLTYKPNCITETIMVYRKKAPFLIEHNLKKYENFKPSLIDHIEKTNCWYISPSHNKNHPAVFPEKLCQKILHYYSFPNDVILDPFAGSGTVAKVALRMNRVPISCEKNEDYLKNLKLIYALKNLNNN